MTKILIILGLITNINVTQGNIEHQSTLNNHKYNHVEQWIIPAADTNTIGDTVIIIGSGDEYITHVTIK